ncbi:MAG: DEAD/DEAH box helicase, partial [Acidobacteriota bacterium]
DEGDELPTGLAIATSNDQALRAIGPDTAVGGTAWLWSRDDAAGTLDTLIVDEAGQMSLAQVLAVSRAARNLILLGDPQQLQQPQQGTHPEGADAAALLHILGGGKTIADDRGLFLDETWRLAPPIAAFTSELYYEGRLLAHAGLDRQEILGNSPFAGSGLFVVPVAHEGNQSSSPEEVDAIDAIVDSLLGSGLEWRDRDGVVRPLEPGDILIVSPYNAQVFALQERRPTMRIGTVDRFQGQEAPIVIYSMAVSAPEDAPRGMSFLYEPNRFNVATSRAKCAVILVASPRLFEPDCQSVAQMRMANGIARFVELGHPSP